jgi:hypothetical protein
VIEHLGDFPPLLASHHRAPPSDAGPLARVGMRLPAPMWAKHADNSHYPTRKIAIQLLARKL